ncbi:MAG TPA: hypothetical protein VGY56_11355 [Verrucomicrobiae bacterium]|nr:hypothetical protein [Verrucomicrobiae bacterium]
MSDESKNLEFKITAAYDGSGPKKAADDFEAVGDAAKKASGTGTDFGETLEGVAKRAEGVSGESREMYRIFSELNRIAPGLGESLRAAMTGPLGAASLLVLGLYEAKVALEEYEKALDNILGEDLTAGIDKANLLAVAYNGIAEAVQKANEQFNSAEAQTSRAEKNIAGQLTFTKQLIDAEKALALQRLENAKANGQISEAEFEVRKEAVEGQSQAATAQAERRALQAQLSQKHIDAANSQAQADASARKAASFHLPQSDKVAEAEATTLTGQAEEQKKLSADARERAAILNDIVVSFQSSAVQGLFASLMHPIVSSEEMLSRGGMAGMMPALFPLFVSSDAARKRAETAQEKSNYEGLTRASGNIDSEIKAREAAREDAQRLAGDAVKARDEAAWESDPNNAGSLAGKLQQNSALAAHSLDKMGAATAAGMEKLSGIAQGHTANIERITSQMDKIHDRLDQLQNAIHNNP